MERIYHRFEYWEDHQFGLYASKENKEELKNKVVELFSNHKKTEKYMRLVIKKWKFSCEHNLTNIALNRVAWIGQAACCIYAGVPYRLTMEAWWSVSEGNRNKADKIAEIVINEYLKTLENRQLCLKFI